MPRQWRGAALRHRAFLLTRQSAAYTACAWNGPARTNLNPVQEVDAAVKRVDAGFSTAQEETATMTGGDYNRNIRQRVIEAKRKREVDEITNPQAKPPGGQQEE